MSNYNLLFLYTDEQRFDTLQAYGNNRIGMPNLNRLAANSTVFERAYVTQPVCTPSRSSLLTGVYPHTNGCVENNIALRETTPCVPEMLPANRYACAHHGKWHLGNEIYPQHGFTEWMATEDTYHRYYQPPHREYEDRSAYHHWLVNQGVVPESTAMSDSELADMPWKRNRFFRNQITQFPEQYSRPAFLGETAQSFINHNHSSRPWVLYVNFLEPHMPFHSARDSQYDPSTVSLPPDFCELADNATLKARYRAAHLKKYGYDGQPLANEKEWRQLVAQYWGLCSLADDYIGRILNALSESGQAEKTIIVFTSDHGDMMGSHGLLAKTFMYEESVRIPFMIHMPRRNSHQRITRPVSQIDVVPTILDLMGHDIPSHLEGRSLRHEMEGTTGQPRDVFIEWTNDTRKMPSLEPELLGTAETQEIAASISDDIRTVITPDGWKFIWSRIGENELFNLKSDPYEQKNCAGDTSCKDIMEDLKGRIRSWQESTKDELVIA